MSMAEAAGQPCAIAFALKRGSDELMLKLAEDGYLMPDVLHYLSGRKDIKILTAAAFKCGLVNLPGGEDAT